MALKRRHATRKKRKPGNLPPEALAKALLKITPEWDAERVYKRLTGGNMPPVDSRADKRYDSDYGCEKRDR